MLLRVSDDLHRRLAIRAEQEGRSVNALANEILDGAVDVDQGDRRARLRAKAAGAGALRDVPAQRVESERRRQVVESMRGIGPVLDDLLAQDRDRL